MPRQPFVLVLGALVVTLATVGLISVQSASPANGSIDRLVEQTAPSLRALGRLESAADQLIQTATDLSPPGSSAAGELSENVTPAAFRDAYVDLQDALIRYEGMHVGADEPLQEALRATGGNLLTQAAAWQELFAGGDTAGARRQLERLQTAQHAFIDAVEEAMFAEAALLAQQGELARESTQRTRLFNVITSSIAVLLAVTFGGFVVQQVARTQSRQADLSAANASLENEVARRAGELEQANRELNRQLEQRRRAEQERADHNRKLEGFLRVSQQLAGHLTLEERLQAVVDGVLAALAPAEIASLWLKQPGTGKLQLRVRSQAGDVPGEAEGLPPELLYVLSDCERARTPQANGQSGAVPPSRQSVPLPPAAQRSVLGAPLLSDGDLIGVLAVENSAEAHASDADDQRLLQSLADQAALAIRNTQLLETTIRHRRELQRLSTQLMAVRESESKRISRELHDGMGQALTAVGINLAKLKQELPEDADPGLQARIAESEALTLQTLAEIRALALELRPSMLDDLGLVSTLRWYVRQFGRRLNMSATFAVTGVRDRLPAEVETVLYRVAQEALTNVARHADAGAVHVHLQCGGGLLTLAITDDGQGFDPGTGGTGTGLLGMRERVAAIGGSLRVDSARGSGTRLTVQMTCPPPAGQEEETVETHV